MNIFYFVEQWRKFLAARLAVTIGRTVAIGLAVFDRVIGRVDLVHFFRRVRVVRVQVRISTIASFTFIAPY